MSPSSWVPLPGQNWLPKSKKEIEALGVINWCEFRISLEQFKNLPNPMYSKALNAIREEITSEEFFPLNIVWIKLSKMLIFSKLVFPYLAFLIFIKSQ